MDETEIKRVIEIINKLIESEIGDSERLVDMRAQFTETGEFSNDDKIYFREKLKEYKQSREIRKGRCFRCEKEFSIFGINWSAISLAHLGIIAPTGMKDEDKVCGSCKDQLHSESKIAKQEAKNEISDSNDSLTKRGAEYKLNWNKNGIIQFKNERIAILQRMVGSQVQFIVAYDDLTKEGYRLMAIDEGMSGGQSSGGFTSGVNAYFYFQKMEFVR